MTDPSTLGNQENARLREALTAVVVALDDAIKHNVNATDGDAAGWTQESYNDWAHALEMGEAMLREDG